MRRCAGHTFGDLPDCRVVIACNTAHLLEGEIAALVGHPVVSLIEAAAGAAAAHGSRIGIAASPTTIRTGLYRDALRRYGAACVEPTRRECGVLEKCIRGVIAGSAPVKFQPNLEEIVAALLDRGATAVILGCTELSVIGTPHYRAETVDPLDAVIPLLLDSAPVCTGSVSGGAAETEECGGQQSGPAG